MGKEWVYKNCYTNKIFFCIWNFSDSSHFCLLNSCQHIARPSLWVFGRSLYTLGLVFAQKPLKKAHSLPRKSVGQVFLASTTLQYPIDKYGFHISWIFLGVSTELNTNTRNRTLENIWVGYPDVDFSALSSEESLDPQQEGINILLAPSHSIISYRKYFWTSSTNTIYFVNNFILHGVNLL